MAIESLKQLDQHLSNTTSAQSPIGMSDTFLGRMPNYPGFREYFNPENVKEAITEGAGALSGMNMIKAGEVAIPALKAGAKYLKPEKAAEEFRTSIGEGTSKENIAKIGEKVQSSKEKAISEALEPKNKLFSKYEDSSIIESPESSPYLSDEDVTKFYQKKGSLLKKHNAYKEEPILKNYDALQSALKTEKRELESRPFLGDVAEEKLNQLKLNIENLDKDVSNWAEKLPEEDKNLERTWRTLYRENVGPYENAPNVVKNLAEGKWEEVTPAQVAKTFTHMTKETKKIFQDLPPETTKMILYNAIQKVPPGDAGEMAKTILDLKRTKGYDKFITPEMENWAYNMQKQVERSTLIKDALKLTAGATTGGIVAGPAGAIVGAALPFAKEGAKKAVKLVKKIKK